MRWRATGTKEKSFAQRIIANANALFYDQNSMLTCTDRSGPVAAAAWREIVFMCMARFMGRCKIV